LLNAIKINNLIHLDIRDFQLSEVSLPCKPGLLINQLGSLSDYENFMLFANYIFALSVVACIGCVLSQGDSVPRFVSLVAASMYSKRQQGSEDFIDYYWLFQWRLLSMHCVDTIAT
jgi:hypothetical protein